MPGLYPIRPLVDVRRGNCHIPLATRRDLWKRRRELIARLVAAGLLPPGPALAALATCAIRLPQHEHTVRHQTCEARVELACATEPSRSAQELRESCTDFMGGFRTILDATRGRALTWIHASHWEREPRVAVRLRLLLRPKP